MTHNNDPKKETGALRDDQNKLIFSEGFSFSGYERDPLYLNTEGKKFVDISGVSGIDSITDGRAGVFADFDNDGDLDVFVTTLQGQAHLLFRNNVGQENRSLRISLDGGSQVGRDASGAVVRVKTSAGTLTKVSSTGSGFISQHDSRLLFGLKDQDTVQSVAVTWPDGKTEQFETSALKAGGHAVLKYGTGRPELLQTARAQLPDPLDAGQITARALKARVGQPLPDFPVTTLSGEKSSLRQLLRPGRRSVLNLWATWCVPCAKEMPELNQLRQELAANRIDVIGVSVDTEPDADVAGFLKRIPVEYPIVLGGVQAVESLYATDRLTVPISIMLDDKGVVLEVIPGWSDRTRQRFHALSAAGD